MRAAFVAPLICLLLTGVLAGQERRFPYSAIVDVEEEPVRSGPGPKYYVTAKLNRGTKVMVHRHDPGGWYMIAPPEGSFSWVKTDHVQRTAPDRGTITMNNVIVRVGSAFGDDVEIWQRSLSRGDPVQILGQKTFQADSGPVTMYKIVPPEREFRWIAGKAVVPADAPKPSFPPPDANPLVAKQILPVDEQEFASDPVPTKSSTEVVERPMIKSGGAEATGSGGSKVVVADDGGFRHRLAEADDHFRTMIKDAPSAWDLAGLEQAYRQLETDASHPASATQLKLRLDAVERYAKIKRNWEEVTRITAETRARDAQLISMAQNGQGVAGQTISGQQQDVLSPPAAGIAGTAIGAAQPAVTPQAPVRGPAQYAGAGILQRGGGNIPGGAPYVLIGLDNRILAHLYPVQGLDLASLVGRQLAVVGERTYRQELQADVIVVRQVQPVRLRP
jgi:uncharacterized protein YgiM (DUF1202 family)